MGYPSKSPSQGQEFTAILENDAVFLTLLQSVPNRVLQIGLCGQVQKFDRASKQFEVSHGNEVIHNMILQVRKTVEFGNAERDIERHSRQSS